MNFQIKSLGFDWKLEIGELICCLIHLLSPHPSLFRKVRK